MYSFMYRSIANKNIGIDDCNEKNSSEEEQNWQCEVIFVCVYGTVLNLCIYSYVLRYIHTVLQVGVRYSIMCTVVAELYLLYNSLLSC